MQAGRSLEHTAWSLELQNLHFAHKTAQRELLKAWKGKETESHMQI